MAARLLPFLLLLLLHQPAFAVNFTCRAPGGAARCQALVSYTARNDTNLAQIMTLFQIRSFRSLLAANGLPLFTPPSRPVPAGSTLRIRLSCSCSAGRGASAHRPLYRIAPGEGLDSIAQNVFNGLISYQEIAAANNISDPNLIQIGQEIYIPLPCSCDEVEGEPVVHYAHVVTSGSTVSGIAAEFGTKEETLLNLNGISDPKTLEAGQVLDVPLRACSSSIGSASADSGLLVSNGSYILTANNCVLCSCSSSSWELDCHPTRGLSSSVCPVATCGNLSLGNSSSSTSTACESTTCTYAGYTNSTNFDILTSLTTQSLCNSAGAPVPQPSDGFSLLVEARSSSSFLLLSVALAMALLGWSSS